MLLRGAETKTAKWCTRLSNWNVSGLDRIPQSFSFSLFFFFFSCSFVYRSRERITLGTVRFRERSRYEWIRRSRDGKTRGETLQNFSAKEYLFLRGHVSEQRIPIFVFVYRKCGRAEREEKKKWVWKKAPIYFQRSASFVARINECRGSGARYLTANSSVKRW